MKDTAIFATRLSPRAVYFIQTGGSALSITYNLCCNDAVPWLNEVTSQIFRPIANFENFEIHLYFICQPAVRLGSATCRAPEISCNKGNGSGFTKILF